MEGTRRVWRESDSLSRCLQRNKDKRMAPGHADQWRGPAGTRGHVKGSGSQERQMEVSGVQDRRIGRSPGNKNAGGGLWGCVTV